MRTILFLILLAVVACREPQHDFPNSPPATKTKRVTAPPVPPPPPTDEEITAYAPKWQQELPPVIDTTGVRPAKCTGEAFLLDPYAASPGAKRFRGSKVLKSTRLQSEKTAELIQVLNSPAIYWPSGNLCSCCPVVGLRVQCADRTHEIVIDAECGWLHPSTDERDTRALSVLGRWSLTAFANELFPR